MSLKKPQGLIEYLLLHLLEEKDSYGYELIKKIEELSGNYWNPSYGTIYGTLSRLKDEGYLKRVEKEYEDRKYFTITKKGKEKLEKYASKDRELRKKSEEIILGLMNIYKKFNGEKKFLQLINKIKEDFDEVK